MSLFELRPVQSKALDMMRASVGGGKKRPQLQLPTGSGKTVIAAHMVTGGLNKGKRVAFCAPLISLIDQTVTRFEENGIDPDAIGVMQADHPRHRPNAPVQVCSVSTLGHREFPASDFVIVDESHLQFKVIYKWMAEDDKRLFVGLSATPWAAGMGKHYDDLLVPATIRELIAAGDLCPFKAYAPTKPDLSGVKVVAGEYHEGQLSELMSGKSITADVVETWLKRAQGLPTMLFAVDRAHAGKLADEFRDAGVRSAYVDAYTSRDERAAIRDLFHAREIQVICSVGTMTHGVDMDVRCVQFCRPTKSHILYVQAVGRGLRTAPGKTHLLLLDHSNATLDLGLVTEIGFDQLRGGSNGGGAGEQKPRPLPKPRECPQCGEVVPATVRTCGCGHVFRVASHVVTEAGDLHEIGEGFTKAQKRANKQFSAVEKLSFWAQLTHIGETRGYRSGWAATQYKIRFGAWPDRSLGVRSVEPEPPSYETLSYVRSRMIAYAKSMKG